MAGRKDDLAELIRRLKRESEKAGLYFNIKKTKIMTTAEWDTFEMDGEEIGVVTSLSFLGSMVEKEGRCDKEVRRRISMGKAAMQGMDKIWRDRHVSLQTKTRLVKAMIFPIVLYGGEMKTKALDDNIAACEMWMWRRLLGISWKERRTNESVLQDIGQLRGDMSLLQMIIKQKLMFFGHVMRTDGLEKAMMLACGEGTRRRGRPRIRWMEDVHRRTGMNLGQLRDVTQNRTEWRRLAMTVARVPRTDGTR